MRSETVKQIALTEAIEELEGILVSLRNTGACRVNGQDLRISDTVHLEIEAESEGEGGELEFEIGWTNAQPAQQTRVSILIGSRSELPVFRPATLVLDGLGIANELRVVSAHRTPRELLAYLVEAEERGVEVFIAAAGGAAHLAGIVAANVMAPVIGVPSTSLQGLDSLLSIAQMPQGAPVATVAIGGAENAALLAARILSLKYPTLREPPNDCRRQQAQALLRDADEQLVAARDMAEATAQ